MTGKQGTVLCFGCFGIDVLNPQLPIGVLLVLGEYLNHIAFLRDKLPLDLREEARIGADVIAATSQYSNSTLDLLEDETLPLRPLPLFALSRSVVYGLNYLVHIDMVQQKKSTPSPTRFSISIMKSWNKSEFSKHFGEFDLKRDYSEEWKNLSEFVHIIPAIKNAGGATFGHGQVNFQFERDLSKYGPHAGLPENFEHQAKQCVEWTSLLILASVVEFRCRFDRLFSFNSPKIRNHIESVVFPDCVNSIVEILDSNEFQRINRKFAKKIFSST